MAHPSNTYFLVADIGGTNTRVALSDGIELLKPSIRRYRNAEHEGLETVLRQYIEAEGGVVPKALCVDVAGPVRDGKARLTNLAWEMTEASLADATGASHVSILNDLQAQGHAVAHLSDEDLQTVRTGADARVGAPQLVVNLGTGFNASPVFHAPNGSYVATSEAGHANMPIRTMRDFRLCAFVEAQHGFAAVDDILSGRGLERVYAFVAQEAGQPASLSSADIMAKCTAKSDPIAVETVRYFVQLTGMVVSNLALVQLPFGGIYLVGGLSGAIAPFFEAFDFEAAFRDKGRFSAFMDDFSIHVVQDDYAALKGNASHLDAMFSQE